MIPWLDILREGWDELELFLRELSILDRDAGIYYVVHDDQRHDPAEQTFFTKIVS